MLKFFKTVVARLIELRRARIEHAIKHGYIYGWY